MLDPNIILAAAPQAQQPPNPLQIMGQVGQIHAQQQESQLRQLQIQQAQQQAQADAALVAAMHAPGLYKPDGSLDVNEAMTRLAPTAGARLLPTLLEKDAAHQKTLADLTKLRWDSKEKQAETISNIGSEMDHLLKASGDPGVAAAHGISRFGELLNQNLVQPGDVRPYILQMSDAQGNLDPSKVPQTIGAMIQASSKAAEQRANAEEKLSAAKKTAQPNKEAIAMQAAAGDQTAQRALDLLNAGQRPTNEQDDQRYRNIQAALVQKQPVAPADLAWAQGYEKQKTLSVDTSASAAAARQAQAIQAQVAQQQRAQDFQVGQAGRKEYTEKVATPYQTALASSQTLRDTVAAAQSGNKVAANLQNLETAMSAIRAQGLNRINTTEIGVAADAGNLWDRVQNAYGKLAKGQPVDPALQKDMLQFADILDKAATLKYRKGRASLLDVYPGSKLPDESLATTPVSGVTHRFNPATGKIEDVR